MSKTEKVLAPDCYIKSMLVLESNCLKHNTLYTDITVATCFISQIFLYTSYVFKQFTRHM